MVCKVHPPSSPRKHTKHDTHRCPILQRVCVFGPSNLGDFFPLKWPSFFHRPGHGQANVNAPVSISYNRNISMQTLKWAIVDWLQHKHRHGIWSVRPFPSVCSFIWLWGVFRTSLNHTFLYSRTKFADSKPSFFPGVLELQCPLVQDRRMECSWARNPILLNVSAV